MLPSWESWEGWGLGRFTDRGKTSGSPAGERELNPIARAFLKIAWLANPFAYLAITTVIAVIPSLARELKLSPMFAGFFCSVWLFVRVGAFALLWIWPGWHYRFRWLLGAYAAMIGSFALMLLARNLPLLVLVVLLDGRGRDQKRTRRYSRGGDRRGQLRRTGHWRRRAAFLSGRARQQRVGRERDAHHRFGGLNLAPDQKIGLSLSAFRLPCSIFGWGAKHLRPLTLRRRCRDTPVDGACVWKLANGWSCVHPSPGTADTDVVAHDVTM